MRFPDVLHTEPRPHAKRGMASGGKCSLVTRSEREVSQVTVMFLAFGWPGSIASGRERNK